MDDEVCTATLKNVALASYLSATAAEERESSTSKSAIVVSGYDDAMR
jgi:hypothetical protein